ncbi:MAG: tyrosine recombinase [Actinomycetota bacterium]|nr:tyrosine recombinase [Actinomycetota bacterium]
MAEIQAHDLHAIDGYLDELRLVYGRSSNTVEAYYADLLRAAEGLGDLGASLTGASAVQLTELIASLRGRLADSTLARMASTLRNFYAFLVETGAMEESPMAGVEAPRAPYLLPDILSVEQVEALLDAVDTGRPGGLRDRALIELLYGSGLRVSEAAALNLEDFLEDEGLARVTGKGAKTRIVPLTPPAARLLGEYIYGGQRARSLKRRSEPAVFLSLRGSRLTRQAIWQLIRKYALLAGLGAGIHPHTLRHSCATHMVNGGADIRVVQELLGHASVATTQIYTHVEPARLLAVYRGSHPRADSRA